MLRTRDGGATWQCIDAWASHAYHSPSLRTAVQFVSADSGWMNSNSPIRTTDAGATWLTPATEPHAKTGYYYDHTCLFALSRRDVWIGWGDGGPNDEADTSGYLAWSNDAGATWRNTSFFDSIEVLGVYFADEEDGWLAGHEAHAEKEGPCPGEDVIYATHDGGRRWARAEVLGKWYSFHAFVRAGSRVMVLLTDADKPWNRARHDVLVDLR